MEVHSISSSTALLSLSSANFCPEAQCSHVQILPKHSGWQPSVYTQDNSQPKFLFSGFRRCFHVVLNSVLGQEATWFCYCFAWMIAEYRPLWMWGFLPCIGSRVLEVLPRVPRLNQQKTVMTVTPHCPLPAWKPDTAKLHLITAAGQCWAAFAYSD